MSPAIRKGVTALPDEGYLEALERLNQQCNGNALLRIWQILGDKKRGIPALIPIGRASFYRGIQEGRYPAPSHHLGPSTAVWYYRDIMAVIQNTCEKQEGGKQ